MSLEKKPEPQEKGEHNANETDADLESSTIKTQETNEASQLQKDLDAISTELFPGLNAESGRKVYSQAIDGISIIAKQYVETDLENCRHYFEQVNVSNDSEDKIEEETSVPSELLEAYVYSRDAGFTHSEFKELIDASHTDSLQELLIEKLKTETELMSKRLEQSRLHIEEMEEGIRSYFEKMGIGYPLRRQSEIVLMGKYGSLALKSAESGTLNVISAGGRFIEETGAIYLIQNEDENEDNGEELSNKQMHTLVHERMHSLSSLQIPIQVPEKMLQQDRTQGFEVGFTAVSEDGKHQYSGLNEAATEYFSRNICDSLGYKYVGSYHEETESFKSLLKYLSENEKKYDSETVFLKRYIESSGISSFKSEVEENIGPHGLEMCNALMIRPKMLEAFLKNVSALKSGEETQSLEMSVDVLLNATPSMEPQEIQNAYPFINFFTHVKDPETQEWKKVPYNEEEKNENEINDVENQAVITDDEFLSIHEEMFKMGQTMFVSETPQEYKERVQEQWEKRRMELLNERKMEETKGDIQETVASRESETQLEQEIQDVYRDVYFNRRGSLSDDLFAVSKGANPDSDEDVRMYEQVEGAVGMQFDSHGIDKGNQLDNLITLLRDGVDPSRDFYTAPFEVPDTVRAEMAVAMGTSGGTAYKGGFAVVTGGYKEKIHESGIKHVFINDIYKDVIPLLAKRFPQVKIHALSEQKEVLEGEAKLDTTENSE